MDIPSQTSIPTVKKKIILPLSNDHSRSVSVLPDQSETPLGSLYSETTGCKRIILLYRSVTVKEAPAPLQTAANNTRLTLPGCIAMSRIDIEAEGNLFLKVVSKNPAFGKGAPSGCMQTS